MQENQEELNQKQIEQCYLEMYRCMVDKDTGELSKLLDESFVLVHMTGMKQPKQAFLEYIASGRLRYYSSQMENIAVKIDGESARLIGQNKVSAAVFGGGRHTWSLQLMIQLINRNGLWLMTQAVASTY